MKVVAVIVCLSVCLGLTVGQVQLRVYRGTLVHSRVLEEIEVLQDHLLGFDENNLGEVTTACSTFSFITAQPCVVIPIIGCGRAKNRTLLATIRLEPVGERFLTAKKYV